MGVLFFRLELLEEQEILIEGRMLWVYGNDEIGAVHEARRQRQGVAKESQHRRGVGLLPVHCKPGELAQAPAAFSEPMQFLTAEAIRGQAGFRVHHAGEGSRKLVRLPGNERKGTW